MGRTFGLRRLAAALALVSLVLAGPAPVAAAAPDPILLVHGWTGHPSTWQQMIDRFAAQGRTAVAIDLATENNVTNAAQIRDFIAARGWTRVDIVAQSMGGLSARYFIKTLGTTRVDTYVSLGTPQYGIYAACFLPTNSGGQMCPWSSFIRNLNSGDDTPPGAGATPVYWTTIYSASDGVVPTSASRLDGGACHVYENPGTGHNEMDNDATTFTHVLAAVDRSCAGTFK